MEEYIYKDDVVYNSFYNNWIYFKQNNKLFKGQSERLFEHGVLKYKLKSKQEIKYGLLTQNPKIKKVIIDFGLPIIHHRNIYRYYKKEGLKCIGK